MIKVLAEKKNTYMEIRNRINDFACNKEIARR